MRAWSAWAPGLETPEDWRGWAAQPAPLGAEGHPEARFLPPMLRRRCTPLTRTMLTAAWGCCGPESLPAVRTVFASSHGSINESIHLLEAIARGKPLSPARFSHTVHNAQAGLFSIAAGNREASSSLSGQAETFACAWLEALTHLERDPGRDVLLVVGAVPLAETFAPLVDEPPAAYAVALRLGRGGDGDAIGLGLEGEGTNGAERAWPDAAEFLRWLHAGQRSLALGRPPRVWRFTRESAAT